MSILGNQKLSEDQQENLFSILRTRFEKNVSRHQNLKWDTVLERLNSNTNKLWILHNMEITGGEPDVVQFNETTKAFTFFDCVAESPKERRSLCYDKSALESRKKFKPKNNALDLAKNIGVELLTEAQYKHLQTLGNFDSKTSSWLKTPENIRTLGGAIFGDFRFDTVFIYHNGAESYYGSRGFRGFVTI